MIPRLPLFALRCRAAWLLLLPALFLHACNQGGSADIQDTYSSGTIRIAVDNSLKPVMESQLAVFHDTYKEARIRPIYTSEAEAMRLLGLDSVRLVIVPRQITEAEAAPLRAKRIEPQTTLVAMDGVALVAHPGVTDSCISVTNLKAALRGEANTWGKAFGRKGRGANDSLRLVVDAAGGSVVRYLIDSLNAGQQLPRFVYAAGSNQQVIDYVASHPNAVGLIGLAWVSDHNDSTTQVFLDRVKLLSVSAQPTAVGEAAPGTDCFEPYLVYLLRKQYPLRRRVYVHSRETRNALGTGLTSFLAGQRGQLLFRQADLLPGQSYIRLVDVQEQPVNLPDVKGR